MDYVSLALGLGLGAAFGFLLAFWRLRSGGAGPEASQKLEAELRGRLAEGAAELAASREALAKSREGEARAQATADAGQRSMEELKARHEGDLRERKEALDREINGLKEAFKALSSDALKEVQPDFIGRIKDLVAGIQVENKGQMEKRQEAIQGLVTPLAEQLKAYSVRLQQAEKDQNQALGDVKAQLEGLRQSSTLLSQETEKFRQVLHSNQARGRWGEETLRRIVEAAGLSPHCDFVTQEREGDSQPDMVVRLPGGRRIVVDAKAPNTQFISELGAAPEERRKDLLKAHADAVKDRVRELAKRDYSTKVEGSLDYVILFLPAESLFSLALEGESELLVWAASQKVILATPASLIGLLKAISVCWTQSLQIENAREINDRAQDLFERVVRFLQHFDGIQKGLASAAKAYNEAVGSYSARIVPAGRKLQELKNISDTEAFKPRETVEFIPRPLPGLAEEAGAGGA